LEILASFLEHESFLAGAAVCRTGDVADRIWLIRAGAVSVRIGGAGAGRRIAAFGPGTTVGEMAVIEGKPRSAAVVVDEPVEAYVLTREAYGALMSEHPDIGFLIFQNISRDLSRRLRQTSDDLRAALT
jgi:CRP-like cAMP-binding protein